MVIKSPCSAEMNLISAFADDTNFFLANLSSTKSVLDQFNEFGKASGSKINIEKTEAIWLGSLKNNIDTPLGIKWVKSTKCLGIYFGHNNLDNQNWLKCFDKYKTSLMLNINRETTLYGKTVILNYIGYSKIWYKALTLLLPSEPCKRPDNTTVDIVKEFDFYTLGFLWGFNNNNSVLKTKTALIAKNTLYLDKVQGGTNLIDFRLKMKAFRILLMYKYNNDHCYKWKNIVKYWFCSALRPITNEQWDNLVPHEINFENIPTFFKQCIIDFKNYYKKYGKGIKEKINTKMIYNNLLKENNYIPTAIKKFPEIRIKNLFNIVVTSKFLDPFLREFLFKFYHCRLNFKRYTINRDILLNWSNFSCILCRQEIDTPKHLFIYCSYGNEIREIRNQLIRKITNLDCNLDEEKLIYAKFNNKIDSNKIVQYLIVLSNYLMYKNKLKKFYCPEELIDTYPMNNDFINNIKNRIFCDFTRMSLVKFFKIWDPGGRKELFEITRDNKIIWLF